MKIRLKELRKAAGLTQEDLADRLDTSKGYISLLESGGRAPGPDMLDRLAEFFNVSPVQLIEDPDIDSEALDFIASLREMDPPARQQIYDYAQFVLSRSR